MTPIMQWFFSQDFKEVNHYNQSVLLSCKKAVKFDHVRKCMDYLIEHHDMLRLNYDESKMSGFIEMILGTILVIWNILIFQMKRI